MIIALLALAGLFLSWYLWLYKTGAVGTLVCGSGGCESVQFSEYSVFLGVDVTLIGMLGYLAIAVVAVWGVGPSRADSLAPSIILAGLGGGALLFTLRLKFLEFFVIGAVCSWCVVSALLVLAIAVLGWSDLQRVRALSR